MFDRLSRSWRLARASWEVLKQDQRLLAFPLMAGAASLVVIAAFVGGAFGLGAFDGLHGGRSVTPAQFLAALAFYVVLYFVTFYANAALVAAVLIRFDGGTPTVGDGLRAANARLGSLFGYAVIAATVGMVLRAIQERVGFVGRLVAGLLGVGWTLATSLVVPVLVTRDVGAFEAVKESGALLKTTWGENVAGRIGLSAAFFLLHVGVALAGVALAGAAVALGNQWLAVLLVAALVVGELLLALVHVALDGIYTAALYRYATGGQVGGGFDVDVLRSAYAPKKR